MKQPNCPYFQSCGACTRLNEDYATQLQHKQEFVTHLFQKAGLDVPVLPTVGLYYPYGFRNKLHLAIQDTPRGAAVGFFEEENNRVVDIDICLVNGAWSQVLISLTKQLVNDFKIAPYNKQTQTGTLKYVVARQLNHAVLVTLVSTTDNFAGKDWFYHQLKQHFADAGVYVNINTRTDNAVFAPGGFIHKYGLQKLNGKMLGISFSLSPDSFFQVNTQIAEKIYRQVAVEIGQQNNLVLDLFSGIGITSLIFAKTGARVWAIENQESAVRDANELAKQNHLSAAVKTVLGTCQEWLPKLQPTIAAGTVVSVFLDPPRSGCELAVLNAIINTAPNTIAYLSCSPETLVRDVQKLLENNRYHITTVQPYDMFPHTDHVETLVILKKT